MFEQLFELALEPWVLRGFSLVCLAFFVTRGLVKVVQKWNATSPEQQQLYNYLKGLLVTSNGWRLRTQNKYNVSIFYEGYNFIPGTFVPGTIAHNAPKYGTPSEKPEVRMDFSDSPNTFSINIGNERVCDILTRGQKSSLFYLAKKIRTSLAQEEKVNNINRLLAKLR